MCGADGPFTYLSFQDHPLRILAEIGKNPETALFFRKDHGISSPLDLKGKHVAYLPGTVSYFFLVRFLEKHGLTQQDLKLTSMQPPTMPQALIGGSIDAFVMWEPWGSQALKQLGDAGGKIVDPSNSYQGFLTTTQEMTQNHPGTVKKVIRSLIKAENFLHSQKEKSIQILSEKIKLDRSILEEYWTQYEYHLHLNLGSIQLMEENARYLQRDDPHFANLPSPHFRDFIDARFLKEIDPSRITLP